MPATSLTPRQVLLTLWWLALLIAALAFLARDVPKYFHYTPESYGEFWPKREALLPHVLGAGVAFLLGFLQFSSRLRSTRPHVHRLLGLIYVSFTVVGAPAAIFLASRSSCALCRPPLVLLGALWLVTTLVALTAARRKDFSLHRAFMIRSFALMNVFSLIRLVDRLPISGLDADDSRVFWEWTCMVLIVCGAEIALTWWPALRRLRRRTAATAPVGG